MRRGAHILHWNDKETAQQFLAVPLPSNHRLECTYQIRPLPSWRPTMAPSARTPAIPTVLKSSRRPIRRMAIGAATIAVEVSPEEFFLDRRANAAAASKATEAVSNPAAMIRLASIGVARSMSHAWSAIRQNTNPARPTIAPINAMEAHRICRRNVSPSSFAARKLKLLHIASPCRHQTDHHTNRCGYAQRAQRTRAKLVDQQLLKFGCLLFCSGCHGISVHAN
jgi:hypothetical protein